MIYNFITLFRNYLYDKKYLKSYKSKIPTICVGNLTLGGNSKTPLVIEIVNYLKTQGKSPVILSRGYGGNLSGPYLITENDTPRNVGDEPCMLASMLKVPVVISKKRALGAKFIESQDLGNVIILDDGFQHRQLERDLNIISAYIGNTKVLGSFLAGKVLPFGKFREDRDRAFLRADIIVFAHRKLKTNTVLDTRLIEILPSELPYLESFVEPIGVFDFEGKEIDIKQGQIVAFTAIAGPQAFFETLEGLGVAIHNTYSFPDHHFFSDAELEKVMTKNPNANFICTEKDYIKIPESYMKNIFYLKTKMLLSDQEKFTQVIDGALKRS